MAKKAAKKPCDSPWSNFLLVVKNIALISHVFGFMLLFSIIIPLIFGEYIAILPLGVIGGGTIVLGQLIYRSIGCDRVLNLQDTFITITFAWVTTIAFTALTFWWIALLMQNSGVEELQNFTNALFESVSGSTSTGLTMISYPERLPRILQWLRSFIEWVGGLGLALFIFSFLHNSWSRYAMHESSTLPTVFQGSLKKTIQVILAIYTSYTILIAVLFIIFGVGVWPSINLSMSCLSTGGFAVMHGSMKTYSFAVKIIAAVGMLLGSFSFTFHFRLFTWKRTALVKEDGQHFVYFCLLISVALLLIFLPGRQETVINTIFQWISAATTCGLSTFASVTLPGYAKFFLMFGMLIGGCLGSTAGGIKVRRIGNIIKIAWNSVSMLNTENTQEKKGSKKEKTARDINKVNFVFKGEVFVRLYQSLMLFCIWMGTLLIGWGLLIYLLPEIEPFNVGFEAISALSNAGLSVGITAASLSAGCKWCLMALMLLGRIEIIPFLATIAAIIPVQAKTSPTQEATKKPYKKKKKSSR